MISGLDRRNYIVYDVQTRKIKETLATTDREESSEQEVLQKSNELISSEDNVESFDTILSYEIQEADALLIYDKKAKLKQINQRVGACLKGKI